jgi:hypothetical protein
MPAGQMLKVLRVILGIKEPKAIKVTRVSKEKLDHKVNKAFVENKVNQEQKDNKVVKEFQVVQVVKVLRGRKVIKASLAMMVLRVPQEVQVLLVQMVLRAILATLDHVVKKVIKAYQVMTAQFKDLKEILETKASVLHYKEPKPQSETYP